MCHRHQLCIPSTTVLLTLIDNRNSSNNIWIMRCGAVAGKRGCMYILYVHCSTLTPIQYMHIFFNTTPIENCILSSTIYATYIFGLLELFPLLF